MAAALSLGSVPLCKSRDGRSVEIKTSTKPVVVYGEPPTFVSAHGRRIVAVGDLHGDLTKTRSALEMAGVLSSDGRDSWTGGESVLVQLGDILDRGEDEIAILSLLKSLSIQAKQRGGAVFQVNGNHETMNVDGDYRYVDDGAFDEGVDFLTYLDDCEQDWEEALLGWCSVSERWKEDRRNSKGHWGPWHLIQKQKGVGARSFLLNPGGPLARELSRHPIILKVDDWLFCHGGLLPHHVTYGIERMNKEASRWMQGHREGDGDPEIPFLATRGYDSVVWNRLYSRDSLSPNSKSWQICSILEETLQAVGAKAMVVGHTPQIAGINCICDKRVWRIDVGMSSGVLDSTPEVLEIVGNKARALRQIDDGYDEYQVLEYT